MNKKYLIILFLIIGIAIGYIIARTDFNQVKNAIPQTCTYYGQTYKNGEEFKVDCNTCSCEGGELFCTTIACGGS